MRLELRANGDTLLSIQTVRLEWQFCTCVCAVVRSELKPSRTPHYSRAGDFGVVHMCNLWNYISDNLTFAWQNNRGRLVVLVRRSVRMMCQPPGQTKPFTEIN